MSSSNVVSSQLTDELSSLLDWRLCLVDTESKDVEAIVEWRLQDGEVVLCGYRLANDSTSGLPLGEDLAESINRLLNEHRLVPLVNLLNTGGGYFRIDDNLSAGEPGYMLWTNAKRREGVSFKPGRVYHWFDEKTDRPLPSTLRNYDEVARLLTHPKILFVENVDLAYTLASIQHPGVLKDFDRKQHVVVWDLNGMRRHFVAQKKM